MPYVRRGTVLRGPLSASCRFEELNVHECRVNQGAGPSDSWFGWSAAVLTCSNDVHASVPLPAGLGWFSRDFREAIVHPPRTTAGMPMSIVPNRPHLTPAKSGSMTARHHSSMGTAALLWVRGTPV